jgi:MFS family permease
MAFTQGILAKLVPDHAPAELRGTAFGVFNLVSGVALLLASVIAGVLWQSLGPSATFLVSAAFSAVAAFGLLYGTLRPSRSNVTGAPRPS